MFSQHAYSRPVYFALVCLLILSLVLTACGGGNTPASTPTSVLKPTPTVKLTVSTINVQESKETAILIEVQPYEELDWTWEVSGTSGGTLNGDKGENVVYTAGKSGIDTVTVRAQLSDGTSVKQSVTINVEPAATEIPPATETSLPPKVILTSLQNEQKVKCENLANGTYPPELEKYIWPVVYVNGIYYPQDEGGKAAKQVEGKWYQTVRFGDCTKTGVDEGKQFQLLLFAANESGNAQLEAYFRNAQATGDWSGIIELPSGLEEHSRIIVIRE